eukprot:gnl/TRDRNA2_/TRDRNA2_173167_c0_seq2.p1 gnl/TRDRNA2_/TRDRNA2_173167_c0~~gnl/TRDRNA2_/TRDRNA2_173167_c0_seq2.p1  ORF type:complete len:239 (-),score=56.86 gnl/TRDRNA2_/TRDRNA2_173167_c0_seq2:23-739(-)
MTTSAPLSSAAAQDQSASQLKLLSTRELLAQCSRRGIDTSNCIEKADVLHLLLENQASRPEAGDCCLTSSSGGKVAVSDEDGPGAAGDTSLQASAVIAEDKRLQKAAKLRAKREAKKQAPCCDAGRQVQREAEEERRRAEDDVWHEKDEEVRGAAISACKQALELVTKAQMIELQKEVLQSKKRQPSKRSDNSFQKEKEAVVAAVAAVRAWHAHAEARASDGHKVKNNQARLLQEAYD